MTQTATIDEDAVRANRMTPSLRSVGVHRFAVDLTSAFDVAQSGREKIAAFMDDIVQLEHGSGFGSTPEEALANVVERVGPGTHTHVLLHIVPRDNTSGRVTPVRYASLAAAIAALADDPVDATKPGFKELWQLVDLSGGLVIAEQGQWFTFGSERFPQAFRHAMAVRRARIALDDAVNDAAIREAKEWSPSPERAITLVLTNEADRRSTTDAKLGRILAKCGANDIAFTFERDGNQIAVRFERIVTLKDRDEERPLVDAFANAVNRIAFAGEDGLCCSMLYCDQYQVSKDGSWIDVLYDT